MLSRHPHLYAQGRLGLVYKPYSFWVNMADALYQSLVLFFAAFGTYAGTDVGIWEFGTVICTECLLVMLLHLAIETKSWVGTDNSSWALVALRHDRFLHVSIDHRPLDVDRRLHLVLLRVRHGLQRCLHRLLRAASTFLGYPTLHGHPAFLADLLACRSVGCFTAVRSFARMRSLPETSNLLLSSFTHGQQCVHPHNPEHRLSG